MQGEPIDLLHGGAARTIGSYLLETPDGLSLFDCGPSSCIPALKEGLAERGVELGEIENLLLSHIHLDHAGAAGALVREHPGLQIWVSEVGAPHLLDPSRLERSARRLYGDAFDELWGELAPVPEENLHVVDERAAGLEVFASPGHASHHVCYFDRASGVAFVGDTAGVCVDGGYVLPPTPPPDIDVERWLESLQTIERWGASTLFLTHFGTVTSVPTHLQTLADNLQRAAALVRESLALEGTDDERRTRFEARMRAELRAHMSEERTAAYESAAGFTMMWPGLARYWRKKEAAAS